MGFLSRYVIVVLFLTAFLVGATGGDVLAGEWTGNVNLLFGRKNLDDDWKPMDEQNEFGIEVDFRKQEWPVSIVVEMLRGSGEGTVSGINFESETNELNLGLRKYWGDTAIGTVDSRFFIGGGISFIRGEVSGLGASLDDTGTGGWIEAGYGLYGEKLHAGLEWKHSTADISIGGVDVKAGGSHYGVFFGFHW